MGNASLSKIIDVVGRKVCRLRVYLGNLGLTKMVSAAQKVYAVADHTKIGKKALVRYSNLSKWQGLITDSGISAPNRRSLKRAGVKLILAD